MALHAAGTPFTGYLSLTTATPAASIPIYVQSKGASNAYTLAANERIYLTTVALSSSDTAAPLVQITDGATTPRIFLSQYAVAYAPLCTTFAPGTLIGTFAVNLKAVAAAVTAGKTIEVRIGGYIAQV